MITTQIMEMDAITVAKLKTDGIALQWRGHYQHVLKFVRMESSLLVKRVRTQMEPMEMGAHPLVSKKGDTLVYNLLPSHAYGPTNSLSSDRTQRT